MKKAFSRGQTQVMFRHLPEAVFDHDDYGLCKVTQVAIGETNVNRDALFGAVADAIAIWPKEFAVKFPNLREEDGRSHFSVGAPREVRFVPYPQVFRCRSCTRTAKFRDLQRRGIASRGGRCSCGGHMHQIRYVQAHNCGRMEELYVPAQGCQAHGPEHLAFYDPGRVKQARWHCASCGTDVQALRMTPCKCAYNSSLPPGPAAEKYLRVVPIGDPSLYAPHTVAFIDFPQGDQSELQAAEDIVPLMLARTWGMLTESVGQTVRARASTSTPEEAHLTAALVEQLRKFEPDNPEVVKYDARTRTPPGSREIGLVKDLVSRFGELPAGPPARWLVEHTTLLDGTDITSIDDVAAMLRRAGDHGGAADIEQAREKAAQLLGLRNLCVINDFPLALCAYGYTRTARDPARTMITPFPVDEMGRIPIYAIAAETEALWFQLDPLQVYAWLIENGLVVDSPPDDIHEAWARLLTRIPGLAQAPHEASYAQPEAVAVRTLLHTMSHLFLRRIEWSGFSPSSVGEYLIPGSLSFILYANRHAETKIGGLTTLFEQRLNTWLWDVVQSGRECVYDPICEDDGGTCAGCTHREHNCARFNRELSRATLYGGPTPHGGEFSGVTLHRGYWENAWQAAPTQ